MFLNINVEGKCAKTANNFSKFNEGRLSSPDFETYDKATINKAQYGFATEMDR